MTFRLYHTDCNLTLEAEEGDQVEMTYSILNDDPDLTTGSIWVVKNNCLNNLATGRVIHSGQRYISSFKLLTLPILNINDYL